MPTDECSHFDKALRFTKHKNSVRWVVSSHFTQEESEIQRGCDLKQLVSGKVRTLTWLPNSQDIFVFNTTTFFYLKNTATDLTAIRMCSQSCVTLRLPKLRKVN